MAKGDLSATELARMLGVTRQRVQQLTSRGSIRYVRVGRKCMIPADEVARVLEDKRTLGYIRHRRFVRDDAV